MENCGSADFFFVDTSQFGPSQDEATENNPSCDTPKEVQGCVESFDDQICVSGDDSSPSRYNAAEGDVSSGGSSPVTGSSSFLKNMPRFKWTEARKNVLVKLFLELKNSKLPKRKRLEVLLDRFKSTEEGNLCSLKAASLEKMCRRILKKQVDPFLDSSIDQMLISVSECALKIYSMQSGTSDCLSFIHILTDLFKINDLEVTEAKILQRYHYLRNMGQINALPLPQQKAQSDCKSLVRVRRWRAREENREKERQRDALRKRESRGKKQVEAAFSDSSERMPWGFLTNDQHITETTENFSGVDFFFVEGNQFKQDEAAQDIVSCDTFEEAHNPAESFDDQICIGDEDFVSSQNNAAEDNATSGSSSSITATSSFLENAPMKTELIDDLLVPHQIMQVDNKSLERVRRWRALQGNRDKERQRDALAKREKRRKIQMIAALSEYHKAQAAERMRRWRATQKNRERERERDALNKREKRKDPDFREKERVWSRLAKREKRKDDTYREVERERNKLAMREKRKDEGFREKERERNKLAKREKRAKDKINYLCASLLKEEVPATEYLNEINLGPQLGNYDPELLFFKEEPIDELVVNQEPSIEYVKEGNGLGVYIKQENSKVETAAECVANDLLAHSIKQETH